MGDNRGWDGPDSPGDAATAEDGGGTTSTGGPSLDEALDCLRCSVRRAVLYHLREGDITDVGALATQVAAADSSHSADGVPDEQRERMQLKLVHTHLPKLARANVVEFDHRSDTVRYTDPPQTVTTLLDSIERIERE